MTSDRLSARIGRDEWPLVILMFCYFFAVITTFWILKPIKKGLFINFYASGAGTFELLSWQLTAAQAEMIAKIGNMLAVFIAVVAFTWLARRLRRQQLTFVFAAFCAAAFLYFLIVLPVAGEATVWGFYIFGDLYNSLMVASFFAFLNDSVSPSEARRMYGPIVLGGVVGGAFGASLLRGLIDHLSLGAWMAICAAATVLVALLAALAGREVVRRGVPVSDPDTAAKAAPKRVSPAVEGARLVFSSRYLLAIVSILGLYEITSTLLDYQFTATIVHYVAGDPTRHISTVYAITNIVALIVQIFLTANIMSRFGVRAALLVTPLLILGASGLFLALPILWIGSSLNTVDNGFNYSINQSARESLYTPLGRDEKYQAKAFIDMFLYRMAKVVAVGVALGANALFDEFTAVRWLAVATIVLSALWVASAAYVGDRFRRLTTMSATGGEHRT